MKKKHRFISLFTISLVMIISGCQSSPNPSSATDDGEVQNIQVQKVSPQKTVSFTEEFPLPNCGGTEKLTQTLGTQVSVSKSVQMGTTVSVSGGAEVGVSAAAKLTMEAAVEATYQQEYDTANSRLDTIEMGAAPKTHVVYTIEWEKQEFSSVVTYELNKEMVQTPYTFTMNVPKLSGSREEKCSDTGSEEPHQVFLDDYYIDKYEVTNGDYATCIADEACAPPINTGSYARKEYYEINEYSNFPVIYIDWEMANAYCEWRGARLPTEAEWEKAARGDSEENTLYPWGSNTVDCSFASFASCLPDTIEVGNYPEGKSPYGVYDMAGNVWEWVADWYDHDYYKVSPPKNPTGPGAGTYRVLRGGAWNSPSDDIRVTYRVMYRPFIASYNLGFRCAKTP
ncbi:MAG: hypothetical protein B5M51_01800 [Anaerolinea sp. 4484_236]|nr:MAG: hypothetical protein B5M51_01800 [Anaerolinea sp. 4484_236]